MHKIDSIGAVAVKPAEREVGDTVGYFGPGNPSLGQPSTRVSYEWLNAVQGELVSVIEAAGLTLDKTNNSQLLAAIIALANNSLAASEVAVANNATTEIDGLLFDSADFKSARIEFDLRRKTDDFDGEFHGSMVASFDGTAWKLLGPSGESDGDDHGCTFTINAVTGQVSILANNMTGTNYEASIAFKVSRFPAST